MVAVPNGEVRKTKNVVVFAFTSIVSILSYIWLLIVLDGWSDGKIYLAEAILTFLFFPLFLVLAYVVDKISN